MAWVGRDLKDHQIPIPQLPNFTFSRIYMSRFHIITGYLILTALLYWSKAPVCIIPWHESHRDSRCEVLLKFGVDRANSEPKLENSSGRDAWKLPRTQHFQHAGGTITTKDFSEFVTVNTHMPTHEHRLKVIIHPYILSRNRNYVQYHLNSNQWYYYSKVVF